MSRVAVALMSVAHVGRALGSRIQRDSQRLDMWAERWLLDHVRRETAERFRTAADALAAAAAKESPGP